MISVIVPVFNTHVDLLERSLRSILIQKVNLEIILVDDGSEPIVANWLDAIAESNVRVFHKPNGGVSSARNFGLDRCLGNYVAFVDPDDELVDGAFEDALEIAIQTGADVVLGGMEYIYPDGRRNPCPQMAACDGSFVVEGQLIRTLERSLFEKSALEEIGLTPIQYVSNCAALYKRSLIQGIRFDEGIVISEDRIFNFEAFEKATRIALAGSVWYRYYQNSDSASHIVRLNAADELSATSRKYLDLCVRYSVEDRVRASVNCGILECFYQALYFSVFDSDFYANFGSSRRQYVKQLMNRPVFAKAFKLSSPAGLRWKILLLFCRHGWADCVLFYLYVMKMLQTIKRNFIYRHAGGELI